MTTQAKTKPANSFVRNIQAIWSDKRSVNTNKPVPNAHPIMTHKDHYAADRATD